MSAFGGFLQANFVLICRRMPDSQQSLLGLLCYRLSRRPDPLEAVKLRGGDFADLSITIAEDAGLRCGDPVQMLIDEKSVINAVDRVVQDGSVYPDLDVLDAHERPK